MIGIQPGAGAGTNPNATPSRLYYLDYLRAAVVALVFLHHTAITYGASGGWYYYSATVTTELPKFLLTLFVTVNQAWFMAFLFFLSGYFSVPSFTRKGAGGYVKDRLRRFGIPLIAYALIISPVTVWLAQVATPGHLSLVGVYVQETPFDFGVLWFVEALLIMDLLFVVWARWLARIDLTARLSAAFPRNRLLLGFAVVIGLTSFVVRLWMPVGATFAGLSLCYFPSYIAMFVLGMIAWRRQWMDAIPDAAFRWARRAVVTGIILLPVVFIVGVSVPNGAEYFLGGLHWQALALALWEQFVLVGMSVVLLHWGQRRLNQASRRWQDWAGASYLAYMIQPLVIVGIAVSIEGLAWPALAKFVVVGALSIVVIYTAARVIRTIPVVRRVVG